jgi:hypothetical protein
MKTPLGVVLSVVILLVASTGAQKPQSRVHPSQSARYHDSDSGDPIQGPCVGDCNPWCVPFIGCF